MTSLLLNGLPRVYQISVSHGGVPKLAVSEARITMLGVEGDRQRNPDIHGGPERAVCLFSFEVIQALQAEGHSIAPGSAGDNVTLAGLDWFSFKPGDRIGLGLVRLELVSYTAPCAHNGRWFLNGDFSRISSLPDSKPQLINEQPLRAICSSNSAVNCFSNRANIAHRTLVPVRNSASLKRRQKLGERRASVKPMSSIP